MDDGSDSRCIDKPAMEYVAVPGVAWPRHQDLVDALILIISQVGGPWVGRLASADPQAVWLRQQGGLEGDHSCGFSKLDIIRLLIDHFSSSLLPFDHPSTIINPF